MIRTMPKRNIARGLFLAAVALFFGAKAARYPIGNLSHAGPGLFPLLISGLLLLVAVAMLVRSRYETSEQLYVNLKNITLIMLSLAGFVLAAQLVDAALAILVLVFVAGFAAPSFNWKRSLQITAGLIVVALALERFLGLNLGLF